MKMVKAGAFGPDVAVFEESQKSSDGRRWWSDLPGIVADLEKEWGIDTGLPFPGGSASWVAPARTVAGGVAVLKVNLPHREARGEASALALWNGAGAVRLYRYDAVRWALLLERCEPGEPLLAAGLAPEQSLSVAAAVLRRLWSAAVPIDSSFDALADVTAEWATLVRERMARHRPPLDPGVIELGAQLLEQLPLDASARTVVLHGDFNPSNVLSSRRESWLAIDAKPMVGDAAYDPVPMIGQVGDLYDLRDTDDVLLRRHELFADLLELPVERIVAWAVARLVEAALWYVSRTENKEAKESMRVATRLAGLSHL
jgi:streptomycin 6-kinase